MKPNSLADNGFTLKSSQGLAALATYYTRARIVGLENLPKGPALLVGNHGVLGAETPVFFHLIFRNTGRMPVGLADRLLWKIGPLRSLFKGLGTMIGTRDNAVRLLKEGNVVVVYPGGVKEVFKNNGQKYRLAWEGCFGFVFVAQRAQVPIVPFAGYGVDDIFRLYGHIKLLKWLTHNDRYAMPIPVGIGPFPLPARLSFGVGRPITPPGLISGEHAIMETWQDTKQSVVRLLLDLALQAKTSR